MNGPFSNQSESGGEPKAVRSADVGSGARPEREAPLDEHRDSPERAVEVDPDEDAIRRILAGDVDAYGEVVARHEGPLRAIVTGIVADRQVVEDVVQESFVIAYRRLESFRGDARFSTWLTRIAIREAGRARSKLRRFWKRLTSLDDATERPTQQQAKASRADRGAESRDQVLSWLAKLPIKERTPFVLHVLEDRSYEEIAAMLDIPSGTVGSHISRAKARLREYLPHEKSRVTPAKSAASPAPDLEGRTRHDITV